MINEKTEEKEENYLQEIIEDLKILRNNFSDEIPKEIIRGGQGDNSLKYKVRKNWWMGVVDNISLIINENILPENISNQAKLFIEKFTDISFNQRLTTVEDIAEANLMIEKILDSQK